MSVNAQYRNRINVLLLTGGLTYGGAERQVVELANSLDQEKFNTFVCSLTGYNPLSINLRSEFVVILKKSKYDLSVIPRLRRIVSERRVDIIHSFLFDANIAARLCRGVRSGPIIISSERNSNYKESILHRLTERVTRPLMSLMVSNSVAGQQFCIHSRGMRKDQTAVVHNGVDLQRFQKDLESGRALRQELRLTDSCRLVGMIGNYKAQKNHRIFVLMAAKLASDHSDVNFLIVGNPLEGSLEANDVFNKTKALSSSLGLADRIKFLSGRDDMVAVYNACDVTVLPSSREGTPNVMLESMACGTPVVASDVADNAFVLRDNVDGRIVGLRDDESTAIEFSGAVQALLSDRGKCTKMGVAARERVEKEFSLARLAEKTANIYTSLLSRQQG